MALNLSLVSPYLDKGADFASGVNFAVAGATAIEHDFFARNNLSIDVTPQSIMTQLDWFDAHLRSAGTGERTAVADALFWVGEIGANDYAYTVIARDTIPPKLVRTMAVQRVTAFVEVCTHCTVRRRHRRRRTPCCSYLGRRAAISANNRMP